MPLSFDSSVEEISYPDGTPKADGADVRIESNTLKLNVDEEPVSIGSQFRIGCRVLVDPSRKDRFCSNLEQVEQVSAEMGSSDYPGKAAGIIVDCTSNFDPAVDQHEGSDRTYSVLLHLPPKDASELVPRLGDKITLTFDATRRFVGGVLKSRGSEHYPTFPIGLVLDVDSGSSEVCVRLLKSNDNDESTWYRFTDVQVVEHWEKKLFEHIPEKWLRSVRTKFSSDIEWVSLGKLMHACSSYHIPVFQRRYCWTEVQWVQLWHDAMAVRRAGPGTQHSLGRVLMRQRSDGSRMILDGQQRFTTVSVLLSALGGRLRQLGARASVGLHDLYGPGRLTPTLDDRPDFQISLAEAYPEGRGSLLECKRLFSRYCAELGAEDCNDLVLSILRCFTLQAFVLQTDQRLQVIFHALTEGWGEEGSSPGIDMSPVDLIRNFVLEHFPDEATMREAHAKYWSPIEQSVGSPNDMECFFQDFLSKQGLQTYRCSLYDDFEAWWATGIPAQQDRSSAWAAERLEVILAFASPGSTRSN